MSRSILGSVLGSVLGMASSKWLRAQQGARREVLASDVGWEQEAEGLEKYIRALSALLEQTAIRLSIDPTVSNFSTQSPDHTIPVSIFILIQTVSVVASRFDAIVANPYFLHRVIQITLRHTAHLFKSIRWKTMSSCSLSQTKNLIRSQNGVP